MKKDLAKMLVFWRFNLFESSLIIVIFATILIDSIVLGKTDWWASVAAVAGVLCVVLSAKGHIACYFFGLIQVSLYAFISWESSLYGEVMLNGLYFVPMQFIGFFSWRKNLDKHDLVKAKSMNISQRLLWFAITAIASLLYGAALEYIDGLAPYWDSFSTILSIIAMILMVQAYVEQWFLWIVVNIVTIIMWCIALCEQKENAGIMIIMWLLFLINSVYGYLNWRKLSQNNDENNKAVII